jgi:hypothetical protein
MDILPKGYERPMDKKERYKSLVERINAYKPLWDKNGVIQFKNERIAILQRNWGRQVEFIIAFDVDALTKDGYSLMAIDEGKTADLSDSYAGGISSYYYFQKTGHTIGHTGDNAEEEGEEEPTTKEEDGPKIGPRQIFDSNGKLVSSYTSWGDP